MEIKDDIRDGNNVSLYEQKKSHTVSLKAKTSSQALTVSVSVYTVSLVVLGVSVWGGGGWGVLYQLVFSSLQSNKSGKGKGISPPSEV